MNHFNVGDRIENSKPFTSPIGTYFPAHTKFTVTIGGYTAARSIRLSADQCGSVVWLSDGLFLTR